MFHRQVVIGLSILFVLFAALAAVYAKAVSAAVPLVGASVSANLVTPLSPIVTTTPVCGLGWNGDLNNPISGELLSISAISPTDMWGVGGYPNSVGNGALSMHWDGQSWGLITTPTFTSTTELASVAAISTNNVWAVGYNGNYALVLHWDGTAWSAMTGTAALQGGTLLGITALANNDIWTVGYRAVSSTAQTLTMHWDGTNWTVIPSPNSTSAHNVLWGVSARANNDVWTVGFYGSGEQTLIEHWDGTQWSIVPSPNVAGPGNNELRGVAAISANDAWAVGYYSYATTRTGQSVTLHWDGTQWSAIANPAMATSSALFGVEALSPNDIWAVGGISGSSGSYLTMHWNGVAWNIAPSPSASGGQYLTSISALSTGDIWATGLGRSVLHYYDPCVPTHLLTSHATWQGPPAQPDTLQQLPITLTLKSGTTEMDYPARFTDPSGFFTVNVGSLPNGTYNWRAKGSKYLANSGQVYITGTENISIIMGLMRAGDCNDDNAVTVLDFNIEKLTFGTGQGESGYDPRADFDGNNRVTVLDFNLQKVNFGQGGAPPIGPGRP